MMPKFDTHEETVNAVIENIYSGKPSIKIEVLSEGVRSHNQYSHIIVEKTVTTTYKALSVVNGNEPITIENNGYTYHFLGKDLHREDGPAKYNNETGEAYWYLNGQLHRDGGPAVVNKNKDREWYRHGIKHREDGPAVENGNGSKIWYLNGKLQSAIDKHGNVVDLNNLLNNLTVNGVISFIKK